MLAECRICANISMRVRKTKSRSTRKKYRSFKIAGGSQRAFLAYIQDKTFCEVDVQLFHNRFIFGLAGIRGSGRFLVPSKFFNKKITRFCDIFCRLYTHYMYTTFVLLQCKTWLHRCWRWEELTAFYWSSYCNWNA